MDSVTFDKEEEVVVAGGANGTIKLWDLEQVKGESLGAWPCALEAGACV